MKRFEFLVDIFRSRTREKFELETATRGDVIEVSSIFAQSIDAFNRKRPFIIRVTGGHNCGKSLVMDVMVATWSDNDSSNNVPYSDKSNMEQKPKQAIYNAREKTIFVNGQSLKIYFVRNMDDFTRIKKETKGYSPTVIFYQDNNLRSLNLNEDLRVSVFGWSCDWKRDWSIESFSKKVDVPLIRKKLKEQQSKKSKMELTI